MHVVKNVRVYDMCVRQYQQIYNRSTNQMASWARGER